MADTVGSAYVELRADLSKLDGDAKSGMLSLERSLEKADALWADIMADAAKAGEDIEASFSEAGREANASLKAIGDGDKFSEVKGDAEKAGEKVEGSFREARKEANQELDKIEKHGGGVFSKIGAAAAAIGAVALFKGVIDQASSLSESINAVNVTFEGAADGIHKLAQEAATSVGLSEAQFNSLAVQFSSFATTIAGPGGDVVATMDDMTTRAADFASVMNIDVADAAAMFQSGLAGETEPLKKFGLDLSAAAVEAFALAEGIIKPGEAMTEQQKVQARYGLLMKQTAKTQGDFANTSDGAANSMRILQAKVANMAAQLGQALLPILAKVASFIADVVIPAIQAIANNFEYIIPVIAALVVGLIAYNAASIAAAVSSAAAWLAAAAPFIAIGVAVAAIGAAVIYAYQHFETFRNIVDAVAAFFTDTVVPILQSVWDGILVGVGFVIEVFGHLTDAVGWVIDKAQMLWDRLEPVRAFLEGAFSLAVAYVKLQWDILTTAIGFVIDMAQALWDRLEPVRAFLEGAFALAIGVVKLEWDILTTAIGFVVDKAQALWDKLEPLRAFLEGAFKLGLEATEKAIKLVRDVFVGVFNKAQDVWDKTEGLRGFLTGAFTTAMDAVQTSLGFVRDSFQWVIDKVSSLIDWIGKIKFPELPGWMSTGGRIGLGVVTLGGSEIVRAVGDADGRIVTKPRLGWTGEDGDEAIIPMTKPARAMQLLDESGLGALWDANTSPGSVRAAGPMVNIQHATFQDATDADLMAQRVSAAMFARIAA